MLNDTDSDEGNKSFDPYLSRIKYLKKKHFFVKLEIILIKPRLYFFQINSIG